MAANAPNSNRLWSDLLVEELFRLGVQTFCVAPGSRSTPLVAAVFRNPRARAVVHFDERGCGYFVLGHAKRDMQPAALVTTSGTAVANCMPAVVEASMSGVPMIVLTADRPSALRDTGANQTIEQNRMFDGYVRWFFELPPPHPDVDPALVLTTVDQAVHRARTDRGPVHLNLPFAEPLLTDAADDEVLSDRLVRDTGYTYGAARVLSIEATMHRWSLDALLYGWCMTGRVAFIGPNASGIDAGVPEGSALGVRIISVDEPRFIGAAQLWATVRFTVAMEDP